MTDDVSKLPAWPEDLRPGSVSGHDEFVWLDESLTAALARMEALLGHVEHREHCGMRLHNTIGCTCGLFDLILACERGKEDQA